MAKKTETKATPPTWQEFEFDRICATVWANLNGTAVTSPQPGEFKRDPYFLRFWTQIEYLAKHFQERQWRAQYEAIKAEVPS